MTAPSITKLPSNPSRALAPGAALCALFVLGGVARAQDFTTDGDTENAKCPLIPTSTLPADVTLSPIRQVFVPADQRTSEKRIVAFGDLFAMNNDTPPLVHDDLRNIFARADLVLGNVEAPITANGGKLELDSNQWFNFHANVAYLKSAMAQYCIDPAKAVFSVANNHSDDQDRWTGTLANLSAVGAAFVGIDRSILPAPAITLKDLGNLRVGVVGWTHLQNNPPAKDFLGYTKYPTWEPSRRVTTRSDWAARKAGLGIDLLVGLPHWDCQFNRYPQPYTVRTASTLHGAGFDLVVGAHQDAPQPVHVWPGPDHDLTLYGTGQITNAINVGNYVFVTVTELVVDDAGRTLEYTVHPFVMRWAGISNLPRLPSSNVCNGRAVSDTERATRWTIVPLASLKDGTSDDRSAYTKFSEHLADVFAP
jgi:Bacterial capsule synthesis protein PGA_cap